MKRHFLSAILLAVPCMSAPVSGAVIFDLSFDTLPSEQGWTLSRIGNHASVPESTAFSVDGNSLFQTTIGLNMASNTAGEISYIYENEPSLASEAMISLFFTTAVTAHQQTRQDFSYGAHRFSIVHNGRHVYVGVKPGELYANGTYYSPTGFDGSIPNSYRLTLDTSDNSYEFYWGGELVASGTSATSSSVSGFYIFDGTGTANANAEVTQLVGVTGTVIPEPSTAALLGLAGTLAFVRRRSAADGL